MSAEIEELAKELCEICCYPAPNPWDTEDHGIWLMRAEMFIDFWKSKQPSEVKE